MQSLSISSNETSQKSAVHLFSIENLSTCNELTVLSVHLCIGVERLYKGVPLKDVTYTLESLVKTSYIQGSPLKFEYM